MNMSWGIPPTSDSCSQRPPIIDRMNIAAPTMIATANRVIPVVAFVSVVLIAKDAAPGMLDVLRLEYTYPITTRPIIMVTARTTMPIAPCPLFFMCLLHLIFSHSLLCHNVLFLFGI
jgi:hypothetical protein